MTSQVLIYNMALGHLEISATIQSTSQSDNKTATLNRFYDVARDQVLKDFNWNFAKAYKELSLTGNTPSNPKYQYEYDYPNDCLAAREIVDSSDKDINFEVCTNTSGQKVINVNLTEATLRYTRRVETEAYFTSEFAVALSWYLAFLIGPSLANLDKAKNAFSVYTFMKSEAMISNANEGFENYEDEAPWLEAR